MSVYQYPESKIIDQVTFRKMGNGAIRAYVHANGAIAHETVQDIRSNLKSEGMESIPFTFDGKPALEVRGFTKETQLIALLSEKGWLGKQTTRLLEKEDQVSWKKKFSMRTLQLSGIFMAIADLGFIHYGFKEAELHKKIYPDRRRDFKDALAGFCYLGGSTVLGAYGRNDQSDIQIRGMAERMLQYARDRGLTVPEDSAVADLGHKRKQSPLGKLNNLLREYPSEIGNMMYFGAGSLIAASAQQHRVWAKKRPGMTDKQFKERRLAGWGDTALGASTMLAGLIGTFVKEKAIDPDKEKHHGMVRDSIDWLKAHPLSIASMLYIGSTACHAFTTWKETSEAMRVLTDPKAPPREKMLADFKKNGIGGRIVFVGATLIGELLLMISSKGHGEGVVSDNTVDDSIVAMAADLIVKQPDHRQEKLIKYMAGFLGRPDVLAKKDEEVEHLLRTQVEALHKNPWACTPHKAPTVEIPHVQRQESLPAWQARVAAGQQTGVQPQLSA